MRWACCIKIKDFLLLCEDVLSPGLAGSPFVIAIDDRILAISDSAKRLGVCPSLDVRLMRTIYPSIEVIQYDHSRYRDLQVLYLDVCAEHSASVEPLGAGEVFLDFTGVKDRSDEARAVASRITATLRKAGMGDRISIRSCSSTSKLVSRIAANMSATPTRCKHCVKVDEDRYVYLDIDDEVRATFVEGLPVGYLWGVDRELIDRLRRFGVSRIGDVRRVPLPVLLGQFGDAAYRVHELSYGIDNQPVLALYPEPESSLCRRFEEALTDSNLLGQVVGEMVGELVDRLHEACAATSLVALVLGFEGRGIAPAESVRLLKRHTVSTGYIVNVVMLMLSGMHIEAAIESVSIRLGGLQSYKAHQIDIFEDPERDGRTEAIDRARTSLEVRFGSHSVVMGRDLVVARRDRMRVLHEAKVSV